MGSLEEYGVCEVVSCELRLPLSLLSLYGAIRHGGNPPMEDSRHTAKLLPNRNNCQNRQWKTSLDVL